MKRVANEGLRSVVYVATLGTHLGDDCFEASREDIANGYPVISESVRAKYLSPHTVWHSEGRAALNSELPRSAKDAKEAGFLPVPDAQSDYHQNGTGNREVKYIHADGREVVFDGDTGKMVTDPKIAGNYNYVNPKIFPMFVTDSSAEVAIPMIIEFELFGIGHFFTDMLPYYLSGNSRD